MPDQKRILAVLGGDLRQVAMTEKLTEYGFGVRVFALCDYEGDVSEDLLRGAVKGAEAVILPLPYTADGETLFAPLCQATVRIPQILSVMERGQRLFCGRADAELLRGAEAIGIPVTDYYDNEALAVLNAIPTAEGALAIALNTLPVTVHGAGVTVIGYGRVAKMTASVFRALGAEVTVCARKISDLAWIRAAGMKAEPVSRLKNAVKDAALVVNTVPVQIIDREILGVMSNQLVIDLASKPGGVDRKAAEEKGIRVIWALSLPGKSAPVTAGEYLAETVRRLLEKEGICI